MMLVIGAIDGLNYKYCGVFRNNDFRSVDFQAGYGALARIRHDNWQRYVVFPRDARQRAYAMSPAARELEPFLDGAVGERWRGRGCEQTRVAPCPEILSGWFMWALRDAVAEAGHYRTALDAQRFYERLAEEIDTGCGQRKGDCLPLRASLVPPWRSEYAADTLKASKSVFDRLLTLDFSGGEVGQSLGTPFQLALVAMATNNQLAPVAREAGSGSDASSIAVPRDVTRRAAASWLATVERTICHFGLPVALAVWAVWLATSLIRRQITPTLVVASALVAAMTTRVVLLGFLDATSIPSDNLLYLSPVVPLSLALVPVVIGGLFRMIGARLPKLGKLRSSDTRGT